MRLSEKIPYSEVIRKVLPELKITEGSEGLRIVFASVFLITLALVLSNQQGYAVKSYAEPQSFPLFLALASLAVLVLLAWAFRNLENKKKK